MITWAMFLLASSCLPVSAARAVPFAIKITLFTHGTRKLWTHSVEPGSIAVTRHPFQDQPEKVVLKRALKEEERRRLQAFLASFPIKTLKKKYASSVRGEGHLLFAMKIGATYKEVIVYYHKQESLRALLDETNRLVPDDFKIHYHF